MNTPETTHADTLIAQGLAASQANDSAGAIHWFLQAAQAAPHAGLPHFLLGSEYAALGEMDKAEGTFANAVLLSPELHLVRYQLGLLQFSSGRAAVALLTWEPLLRLSASDPLPHFVRGFAALAQDRFDEALEHYGQGLQRNTGNAALSSDIEKVIAGIQAVQRAANTENEATPCDSPAPFSEELTHALLSNYQQQGRPH